MLKKKGDRAMKELFVVVDMQVDFITGSLGTAQAQEVVMPLLEALKQAKTGGADIAYTMDTHQENYLDTQEGKHLPVLHCIKGSEGWQLHPALRKPLADALCFEKPSFGSVSLAGHVTQQEYERVTLCGVCTGICVLSNAVLIKSLSPETSVQVLQGCCACVTPQSHQTALDAMAPLQIEVI